MALILLQLMVLGVVAAAAEDVPVTLWRSSRASLACAAPAAGLPAPATGQPRRAPPPLEDDRPRQTRLYVWKKGHTDISGSKRVSPNGTLEVVRKRDNSSEGVYQCGVRHLGGVVLGLPVHLKFAYLEKTFSQHPNNVTARVGQPVTLPCVIESAPPANLAWLKDGQDLPQNSRFHVLKTQLLITDVRPDDSGVYICIATNSIFAQSRHSQAGSVSVVDSSESEPSFLKVDVERNILVERGSRVVLPCPVTGWPRPKLIWEHTPFKGRRSELEATEEVLELPRLEEDQQGLYSCVVEGNSALVQSFNVTILVPVNITEGAATDGAVTRSVQRASTVRFNCSAVGSPPPTVTWFKDGVKLALGGRINIRNSTDFKRQQLVVSGVISEDAGVYQCFAQSGPTIATSYSSLVVLGGAGAAPRALRCWPVGARRVLLRWEAAPAATVLAYTVHVQAEAFQAVGTGQPQINTEEYVNLKRPLTPYTFQVRAYVSNSKNKTVATDLSNSVVCMGQGVPIKLIQMYEDTVLVSWEEFAASAPGVAQWVLQWRGAAGEHNLTLDGHVHNYTLDAPKSSNLQVRVLGSMSRDSWASQDLSLVPWRDLREQDIGDVPASPYDVITPEISSRSISVSFQYDAVIQTLYTVCAKAGDGQEKCVESTHKSATIEDLEPDTEYEVTVSAGPGGRSRPLHVTTERNGGLGPASLPDLSHRFLNASTLEVCWDAPSSPTNYTVHYSNLLKLPVEQWPWMQTSQSCVQIPLSSPSSPTYVMVSSASPAAHSAILTVPPLDSLEDITDLKYEYSESGIRISWGEGGAGRARSVRYAQNITRPLEQWPALTVTGNSVLLSDLDPSLPTYVTVTSGSASRSHVLTVPAPPQRSDTLYIALGVAVGVVVLLAPAALAVCLWRRRKRDHSPVRRRRNLSGNDSNDEDGSEMKSVGGRLANGGGSKDAGEPLLNGHVHITDNPTSKAPNGKIRRGRHYDAFDVSRTDQNTTVETVIDADTSSSTAYNLLDTSRKPEFDVSRSSRDLSSNNSFNKLPDDNMNSELTRSTDFDMDSSKILPTLQPNG